jgi:hypothetical protein
MPIAAASGYPGPLCPWHWPSSTFQVAPVHGHSFATSPRLPREFYRSSCPPQIKGRRECRALDAPAALCANEKTHKHSHHGHTGTTRHSPRNGFNGFLRTLPGDRAFLPPSSLRSLLLKNLISASGYQDHTTSPSAGSARSSAAPPASTASRLTSVTIAKRPFVGRDDSL